MLRVWQNTSQKRRDPSGGESQSQHHLVRLSAHPRLQTLDKGTTKAVGNVGDSSTSTVQAIKPEGCGSETNCTSIEQGPLGPLLNGVQF